MFSLALFAAAILVPVAADAQSVSWTSGIHVGVTATVLQKTDGCDGCDDAGAVSQQEITAGNGYVEFTVGETNTFLLAGMSHGNSNTYYNDIDFAFRFNGAGWADVLENGVYQSGGDTPYAAGDVFRIAIVGDKLQYIRNGVVLIEKPEAIQYPVLLDVTFGTIGATLQNAVVAASPPPPSDGGFVEKAGSHTYRSRFTASQIAAFLPADGAKGAFTFPGAVSHGGRQADQRL